MNKIKSLKDRINSGQFPSDFPHFGGANLIITIDTQRNYHEGDIVVYSEHASALSWLVFELKEINIINALKSVKKLTKFGLKF
jgi:hypothetical protein